VFLTEKNKMKGVCKSPQLYSIIQIMPDKIPLIVKVFRIELEEVENDVNSLMNYYSDRFSNHEITNYVLKENNALLSKEIASVKYLEKELEKWNSSEDFDSAEEAVESLKNFLKMKVKERGYPEFLNLVIDRIGKKVSRYLEK